jgi:hypothetical protein
VPELPGLKRGNTFQLGCLKLNSAGEPEDLTSITIAAQIRNGSDDLIADLVVSKADQTTNPGEFALTADAGDTVDWELGRYYLDAQLTAGTEVVSSETLNFKVVKDITHE